MGPQTDYSRRLAHANFRYGSDILLGPETYRLIESEFAMRPMEMIYDPEARTMTELYQLLASLEQFSEEDKARRDRYRQGVIYIREAKYEEALEEISKAKNAGSDDGGVEFFISAPQKAIAKEAGADSSKDLSAEGHARLINLM